MNSEFLYNIFKKHLTERLELQLDSSFKRKFIDAIEQKGEQLYLKGEELAIDIAAHCNLCEKLTLPVYFQDDVYRVKLDKGLNYFTGRMLKECNKILENHMFTVTSVEESEEDSIKIFYKIAHFSTENMCTMISKYQDFVFDKQTEAQCKISESWIRFYKYNNLTDHISEDTGLVSANGICDSHYCIKLCVVVLYYIKYILNEYDFYIQKREQYLKTQKERPDGVIENIELLMDQIENPRMKHLYAFLQSDNGLDNLSVYTYIAQQLHKNNKISSPTYYSYDMINLADELAKNPSGVKYEYKTVERDRLYIVTGMSAFLKSFDYNSIMYEKKGQHILDVLSQIRENRYIIIVGDKEEIRRFLDLNPRIDFLYKESIFILQNMTPEEMYEEFRKKTSFDLSQNHEFYDEFVEYIALNHNSLPIKNRELVNYLVTYCDNHDGLVLPPSKYKKVEIEQMLEDIIGLEDIKRKIDEFKKFVIFQQKAKALGKKMQTTNFHMIYTGNPGTGKTTIARIMTTLLYQLGIVKEDKLVEVERKDLIGRYIGQTAPKTAEVISRAMGGVLFIDEAYSLANPSSKDFGKEAIATLIKAMEDHADEFVVIFAGYRREMEEFVSINPGIASRIGYKFDFKDYSPQELTEIFELSIHKMGFTIRESLLMEVKKIMTYFSSMDNFGNGRFVKKYVQETMILHSIKNPDNFISVEKEDLPTVEHMSSVVSLKDAEFVRENYTKEDMYVVAAHEIGHAFVYYCLTNKCNFEKITISPEKANVLGYVKYTKMMPNVPKRSDYINVVKTALGGMCAEIVFFGEPSDGNSQDLQMASDVVAMMMSRIGAFDDMLFVSNEITAEKEKQLNKLLNQYYKETITVIENNKQVVEALTKKLLEMETMTAEDFRRVTSKFI